LIQLLKNSWLSFSSQPRPRILQQPFYLSSCFSILFPEKLLSTQPLAPSIRTSSLQREAHSTAFKTAVNTSFLPLSIRSTEPPTEPNHTLSTDAHSTRQIQLCKPFIQLNLLINKKFLKRFIAEVARILHPAECASSLNSNFLRTFSPKGASALQPTCHCGDAHQ